MTDPLTPSVTSPEGPVSGLSALAWIILLFACFASFGSVWLSVGMKLRACPLCFYQRSFVFAIVGIYAIGLAAGAFRPGLFALLGMPCAIAGLVVAGFHVSLEVRGILECPKGMFNLGSAPLQSLACYVILTALMAVEAIGMQRPLALGASLVLGFVLGGLCIVSSPPLPPIPTEPYKTPLDICRPPFQ